MLTEGEFYFGLVIGYITYRTLRRKEDGAAIADIAAVIGAVGGGAILAMFPVDTASFDHYAIGLAAGFFVYLALATVFSLFPSSPVNEFLGD